MDLPIGREPSSLRPGRATDAPGFSRATPDQFEVVACRADFGEKNLNRLANRNEYRDRIRAGTVELRIPWA
jgi:hypothetical protein